ncbi:acetylornithine deacetylase/Succinyl-diaminopimelate desuccinylase and related deacylases [Mesobacillus boroniphilus JCM 21738]|uniref:Acetylornithine deacetylase/Succinyl-diaminopimelate desuccinylase and related deacylases n=1 Tax=Mesobacillus boroniphilus JCM 21738 TaxID=1294265 RepID=W4RM16_9BACI|nr:acetylornithine deacetylase/Succinyl-diaminopimelate desuccinylase and related deacylases [Mesobacillus boroniphilus JCM 21738]
MVPDFAKVELVVQQGQTDVVQRFEEFKRNNELDGKAVVESGKLILELEGVSAHGMEPDNGKNAGLYMAGFLSELNLDGNSEKFFQFVAKYLGKDSRGRELGVAYADDITIDLTINVGKLSYSKDKGGRAGLNMRYPVTTNLEKTKEILNGVLDAEEFSIENFSNSNPHHVDESDFLIQTLKKVYEEQVGEKAELISIGGGTYARSLKSGVAFGPLFPGRPDIAHQKDEYMIIEDLLRATAIYAQAIYELAR